MKEIKCIIFDWAGTTVDYGCFAPVAAFMESFEKIGVPVTAAETRQYMGLTKIEEIRALFSLDRVKKDFFQKFGRDFNEEDVMGRFNDFQQILFDTLEEYSTPIPGITETVAQLRDKGIKIGSTTGYTRAMMDIVIPAAEKRGYKPDNCVTSDHLPGGRPHPYMIYQNMIDLGIPSVDAVIKCGDTIADIKEGVNAKVTSVGIILGSNELGLTENEVKSLSPEELKTRMEEVRRRMLEAGANAVLDSITDLPAYIEQISTEN